MLGGGNASLYLPKRITRARRHTSRLSANKSQERHGSGRRADSPARCPRPSQDLALIHADGPDMLSPKGPCPMVTEQLPPTHNFSHRSACSAEKKKKRKSLTAVHIISLSFKAQSEIHQKKSARCVFFFLFGLYFFAVNCKRELSLF